MQSPLEHVRRVAAVFLMCVVAAVRAAAADTLTVTWDPSVDSNVSGYVVYIGSQPSVYTQTFDIGKTTMFSYVNAVPGQKYYFAVAAYAPGPLFSAKSSEISATSNAAPVLTSPGNQTSNVGQAVTLQLAGRDPEGKPLTYGASGLPAGLMLTTSTGSITGSPTTGGTYSVTASASDGVLKTTVSFTWTVSGTTATAPVPVSPSGTLTTNTPKFVWNAGQAAASYLLVVDDSTGAGKIRTTITAATAGCATTTVCSFSPGVALAIGAGKWVVETLTSTGTGPWSSAMSFTVPDKSGPTVAIVSPSKSGTSIDTKHGMILMTGTASDNVAVSAVSWSNSRGGSGTASGTTSWSAYVGLTAGINTITVTARDNVGNTSTSSFTVIRVVAPTPRSPADGGSASVTPTFSWTAVPAASKYVLKVTDSTLTVKALVTVTPFQAACETTTTCSFKPSVVLAPGTAQWSVEAIALTDLGIWSSAPQFLVVK
jgi:putative Ig domain-containing protein